ncbi:MAG TPA: hypothetical protein VFZ78_08830 [Flavisolibacter sp.]
MKNSSRLLLAGMVSCTLSLSAIAQEKPAQKETPTEKQKKAENADEAVRELEMASKELQEASAQLQQALKEVDWKKIQQEIAEAAKSIDVEKMKKEIIASLQEIDAVKIQAELDKSIAAIDSEKLRKEIEASMKKIDMEKLKKELDEVKKQDFEKLKKEMQQLEEEMNLMKPRIEKSISEAKVSVEKARREVSLYRDFVNEVHAAGLINKEQDYTIDFKKGTLTINGKVHDAAMLNKYPELKQKDFRISKKGDDFNISND